MAIFYYMQNVRYPVVVREYLGDNKGKLLSEIDPYVAVKEENLRDFKIANKQAILAGLIKVTSEPSIDWETPNALSAEEITELLKSFLKLKNTLPTISSLPILYHIKNMAEETNKTPKTITLIQSRIDELTEDEILPGDMQDTN
jgi:hypothetical protein